MIRHNDLCEICLCKILNEDADVIKCAKCLCLVHRNCILQVDEQKSDKIFECPNCFNTGKCCICNKRNGYLIKINGNNMNKVHPICFYSFKKAFEVVNGIIIFSTTKVSKI